jgi:hypothetical protein
MNNAKRKSVVFTGRIWQKPSGEIVIAGIDKKFMSTVSINPGATKRRHAHLYNHFKRILVQEHGSNLRSIRRK